MRLKPLFFIIPLTLNILGTPVVSGDIDYGALVKQDLGKAFQDLSDISNVNYLGHFSNRRELILEQMEKLKNCVEYNREAPSPLLKVFHKLTTLQLQNEMLQTPLTIEGDLLGASRSNLNDYRTKVNQLVPRTEQSLNNAFSLLKDVSEKCHVPFSPPPPVDPKGIDGRLGDAIQALGSLRSLKYLIIYSSNYELVHQLTALFTKYDHKNCPNTPLPDLSILLTPGALQQQMPILKIQGNLLDARDQNIIKGLKDYKDQIDRLITVQEKNLQEANKRLNTAKANCKQAHK